MSSSHENGITKFAAESCSIESCSILKKWKTVTLQRWHDTHTSNKEPHLSNYVKSVYRVADIDDQTYVQCATALTPEMFVWLKHFVCSPFSERDHIHIQWPDALQPLSVDSGKCRTYRVSTCNRDKTVSHHFANWYPPCSQCLCIDVDWRSSWSQHCPSLKANSAAPTTHSREWTRRPVRSLSTITSCSKKEIGECILLASYAYCY